MSVSGLALTSGLMLVSVLTLTWLALLASGVWGDVSNQTDVGVWSGFDTVSDVSYQGDIISVWGDVIIRVDVGRRD